MQQVEFNRTLTSKEVMVSEEAFRQLAGLTADEDDITGVRVFVSGGGCGGMAYGMTFVEEPSEYDAVLKGDDVNVYVDAVALSFLAGVEIDYKVDGLNKSFVFKNVFANTGGAGTCGACGSSGGGCG